MQVMQVNYQDLALYIYVQIHNSTPVQQNTIYIDLLLAHLFWRAYKQLKHWARVCPKNRKALASRLLVGSTQYYVCTLTFYLSMYSTYCRGYLTKNSKAVRWVSVRSLNGFPLDGQPLAETFFATTQRGLWSFIRSLTESVSAQDCKVKQVLKSHNQF